MLEIVRIPALSDNYIWLMHDSEGDQTVVVDPAEAQPVLAAASERGWTIDHIWNTHWHPDHVGGNAEIKAATGCTIVGPAAEADKIGTLDQMVRAGDIVMIGDHVATVLEMPAHTLGHIAYHLADDRILFVGDTLFAMGCGRLFEGTAEQMFANMERLSALPADTQVYCAHEYTLANGRFALTIEPDNADLVKRVAQVEAARARGEATVPTSIGLERETNVFMRANDISEFTRRRKAKDTG